jgi:hypothetical protein
MKPSASIEINRLSGRKLARNWLRLASRGLPSRYRQRPVERRVAIPAFVAQSPKKFFSFPSSSPSPPTARGNGFPTSGRMGARPVIPVGDDECTYCSHSVAWSLIQSIQALHLPLLTEGNHSERRHDIMRLITALRLYLVFGVKIGLTSRGICARHRIIPVRLQ